MQVVIKCEPRTASSRLVSAFKLQGYNSFLLDTPKKYRRVNRLVFNTPYVIKDHTIYWVPKKIKNYKFIHLKRRNHFAQAMSKIVVHTLKDKVPYNPYHPKHNDIIEVQPWQLTIDEVANEINSTKRNIDATTEILKNIPHTVIYTEDIIKDDNLIIELTGGKPDYVNEPEHTSLSRLTPQSVISNYHELKTYFD